MDDDKLKKVSDMAGASSRMIMNGVILLFLLVCIGCLLYSLFTLNFS